MNFFLNSLLHVNKIHMEGYKLSDINCLLLVQSVKLFPYLQFCKSQMGIRKSFQIKFLGLKKF